MIYINAYIDSKYIAKCKSFDLDSRSLEEVTAMRAIWRVFFLWRYSTLVRAYTVYKTEGIFYTHIELVICNHYLQSTFIFSSTRIFDL